ncbi:MAG: NAD-dependent succinate-semialdehyde dehydrogenase [Alphaproteobacteria bacterium]
MTKSLQRKDLLCDKALIGGGWLGLAKTYEVKNPADGSGIGQLPDCGVKETEDAIAKAVQPQKQWAMKTAKQRSIILKKWVELIEKHKDDLALILTWENGKPISESLAEIASGMGYIEWFAEEAKRAYGDIIPGHLPDKRLLVILQPVGITASITPWNFPHSMIARKVGPALAAGCAQIVKPPEQTPFSALAMAKLALEAGLPQGLFSVISSTDARTIGKVLTTDQRVAKFSFTGSTAVGKILMAQAADSVKKISLELGGNAPFLVFDDADLDEAVSGAMASKFRNAGQTCVCANRFIVQKKVVKAFAEKLKTAMEKMVVGNGADEGVTTGPLIDAESLSKVESLVKDATTKGAKIMLGGRRHRLGGFYFEPTLLLDMTPDMLIASNEIFGPVAAIFSFDKDEEAIEYANRTHYGLASYFYAKDMARVFRIAENIETGMVGVNTGMLTTEVAPFGGVKESGLGREGGWQGLREYMNEKYICISL